MKNLILIILLSISFNIVHSQSGWQVRTTPAGSYFNTIYFLNQNTGWAARDGLMYTTIIKTTNRGINWNILTNTLNSTVSDIQFLNDSIGWLDGSSGEIRKTTNGGSNWLLCSCPQCYSSDDFLEIQFLNENTGYAYGDMQLFKSTNSGLNWFLIPMSFIVTKGQFFNPSTGMLVGLGAFTKTTNGGLGWSEYNFINEWTVDICFINNNTGWIASRYGGIFKTTNGGNNWSPQFRDSSKYFNDITFTSPDTGWAVGEYTVNYHTMGFVLKTTNSGQNWFYQKVPSIPYFEIFMFNSMEGWIAGDSLLYTIDGGGSVGIQQLSTEIPLGYKLSQNYPNPFNPSTNIRYQIPKSSYVTVKVYNALGREIETLVNNKQSAGTYETAFDASKYPSGIYFYRLSTNNYTETRKMVLVK